MIFKMKSHHYFQLFCVFCDFDTSILTQCGKRESKISTFSQKISYFSNTFIDSNTKKLSKDHFPNSDIHICENRDILIFNLNALDRGCDTFPALKFYIIFLKKMMRRILKN